MSFFFLSDSCWISPERNALLAFVIPVAVTVLVSYREYLSELKIRKQTNKQTDRKRTNEQRNKQTVPIITTLSKLVHMPANYNWIVHTL